MPNYNVSYFFYHTGALTVDTFFKLVYIRSNTLHNKGQLPGNRPDKATLFCFPNYIDYLSLLKAKYQHEKLIPSHANMAVKKSNVFKAVWRVVLGKPCFF